MTQDGYVAHGAPTFSHTRRILCLLRTLIIYVALPKRQINPLNVSYYGLLISTCVQYCWQLRTYVRSSTSSCSHYFEPINSACMGTGELISLTRSIAEKGRRRFSHILGDIHLDFSFGQMQIPCQCNKCVSSSFPIVLFLGGWKLSWRWECGTALGPREWISEGSGPNP